MYLGIFVLTIRMQKCEKQIWIKYSTNHAFVSQLLKLHDKKLYCQYHHCPLRFFWLAFIPLNEYV
jgi:hypothetical protein